MAAFTGRAHVRPIFFPSNITRSVAKITGLLKTRKNPVTTSIRDRVPRKSKNTVRYRVIVEFFTTVRSLEAKLHETINIGVEIVSASRKIRFCRMAMTVAASVEDELVKMLHQPFYSPNLEPRDYLFLSPRLKITTKGRRYDSSRDTRKSVASILEGIPRKNTRPSRLTHRLLVKIVLFYTGIYFE